MCLAYATSLPGDVTWEKIPLSNVAGGLQTVPTRYGDNYCSARALLIYSAHPRRAR
jgi:hypothetical protein